MHNPSGNDYISGSIFIRYVEWFMSERIFGW